MIFYNLYLLTIANISLIFVWSVMIIIFNYNVFINVIKLFIGFLIKKIEESRIRKQNGR